MKYRCPAAAAAILALLLTSCAPASGPAAPSVPQEDAQVQQPEQTAPEFYHSDRFYLDLGQSLDLVMAPLFKETVDLPSRQQALFFPFFVDWEGLYHGGMDFWDESTGVYRIPVDTVAQVLRQYLGVEDFDPLAAYGEELRHVDYVDVPLGYYPQEGVYVIYQINGWGGARNTRLLAKEKLEGDVVRITEGFYDFGETEDQEPYKRRIYTLRENPEDIHDYTLLSLVDVHLVNGEEITVTDSESHLNLRQPEAEEAGGEVS